MKQLQVVTASWSQEQLWKLWRTLNRVSFNHWLREPAAIHELPDIDHLADRAGRAADLHIFGYCGQNEHSEIVLYIRAGRSAEELIQVMAHEMVHQDLAQRHGYEAMCEIWHGPEFFRRAPQIRKYLNTPLLEDD